MSKKIKNENVHFIYPSNVILMKTVRVFLGDIILKRSIKVIRT